MTIKLRRRSFLAMLVAVGVLLAFGVLAEDKIYHWKDKNGKMVYSQNPPPAGIDAENLNPKVPTPTTEERAEAERRAKLEAINLDAWRKEDARKEISRETFLKKERNEVNAEKNLELKELRINAIRNRNNPSP